MFKAETAFHLAIPVSNLQKARDFYKGLLGAKEGRSAPSWVDFDFFGHQLSCHLTTPKENSVQFNSVDKQSVPIPHFGLIVSLKKFDTLKKILEKEKTQFLLAPQTRFKDREGEQKTMFFKDPFGHCIEIKSYTN